MTERDRESLRDRIKRRAGDMRAERADPTCDEAEPGVARLELNLFDVNEFLALLEHIEGLHEYIDSLEARIRLLEAENLDSLEARIQLQELETLKDE